MTGPSRHARHNGISAGALWKSAGTIAAVLLSAISAFSSEDASPTRLLTATEYAAAKQEQSLRAHLTTSKREYLRREWIFVRYWIENEGTTPAYFHWEDIPEIVLAGLDGAAIPSCWSNDGSVVYDRQGTRRPDGEIANQYLELQPQAKSQVQLREITDMYGVGRGYDCEITDTGLFRIFVPGVPSDTVEIEISEPALDSDSLALELCELAINTVDTKRNTVNPSQSSPWRKDFESQAKLYTRVFEQYPDSPYALLAASRLLSYGYDSFIDAEMRKKVELKLLDVAEQGYIVCLVNLDPAIYTADERSQLRDRFIQLAGRFPRTQSISEFIERVIKKLAS